MEKLYLYDEILEEVVGNEEGYNSTQEVQQALKTMFSYDFQDEQDKAYFEQLEVDDMLKQVKLRIITQ